jgi:hypothetical protein
LPAILSTDSPKPCTDRRPATFRNRHRSIGLISTACGRSPFWPSSPITLFPATVPGGFVGVDVFFVISGFLITRLIIDGLSEKKFSYLEFYARRIKRIFPALILVLATCLTIGWLTFLPDEFQMIGRHVFAGAGFWINFTFYREAGYFDPAINRCFICGRLRSKSNSICYGRRSSPSQ